MAHTNGGHRDGEVRNRLDAICLCLEDHIAHHNGSTLRELLCYYRDAGERCYPKLLELVRQHDNLESLERAYKRAG